MSGSIRMGQAVMIIMTFIGLMNHVLIIPVMLDAARRDAWVSTLVSVPPYLLWIAMLAFIVRRSGQKPITDWISGLGGVWTGRIIRLAVCVYLLAVMFITLKDTVFWAKDSYLPETPLFVLCVLLLLICFFAARSGFAAIAILTGILLPFIVVFGFFIGIGNGPNKDYSFLFPIWEKGYLPMLHGCVPALAGLGELTLFLFMQHHVSTRVRFLHLAITGLILVGLTLGPITGAIAEFGTNEAVKQRYPVFEQWKLLIIAHNIERLDFLSIYQWYAGAFVRLSVSLCLLVELLGKGRSVRYRDIVLLILLVLLLCGALLPFTDNSFYLWLKTQYFWISLPFLVLLTLWLFILALISGRREGRTS
ncbi:spore germination protein (amino acid permease) [Paenibacillus sp. UNCCL117]|uniref:GerAB/ArcD/ProY family transporter n=1 Tax=unclassified Paenibacillus TaxID=185978 RepID=UPI00088BC797|nr:MULTISPECIES: endospore germination permease [unclassified Paenibacillus]SDD25946.1 spore germination protein (amino acid permease) [Paenibacillus sp. cl123]SFW41177.1 spore germination protein (amino acid permease) [Paenibacillus sp. UNCCL117]